MSSAALKSEKTSTALRTIGEAASELGLETHVLRFWETKFRELKPVKRHDGRRFYRAEDLSVLRAIQCLVHEHGMSIRGAQTLLQTQGVDAVLTGEARVMPASLAAESPARTLQDKVRKAFDADELDAEPDSQARARLEGVLSDMSNIKSRLDAVRTARAA